MIYFCLVAATKFRASRPCFGKLSKSNFLSTMLRLDWLYRLVSAQQRVRDASINCSILKGDGWQLETSVDDSSTIMVQMTACFHARVCRRACSCGGRAVGGEVAQDHGEEFRGVEDHLGVSIFVQLACLRSDLYERLDSRAKAS